MAARTRHLAAIATLLAVAVGGCGGSKSDADIAAEYTKAQFRDEAETWVSAKAELQQWSDDLQARCQEFPIEDHPLTCNVTAGPDLEGTWQVVVRDGKVARGEMISSNLEEFTPAP